MEEKIGKCAMHASEECLMCDPISLLILGAVAAAAAVGASGGEYVDESCPSCQGGQGEYCSTCLDGLMRS